MLCFGGSIGPRCGSHELEFVYVEGTDVQLHCKQKPNVGDVKLRSSNMQDPSVRVASGEYTSHCRPREVVNQNRMRVAGAVAVS
jgi:hypothetical protein